MAWVEDEETQRRIRLPELGPAPIICFPVLYGGQRYYNLLVPARADCG